MGTGPATVFCFLETHSKSRDELYPDGGRLRLGLEGRFDRHSKVTGFRSPSHFSGLEGSRAGGSVAASSLTLPSEALFPRAAAHRGPC